MMNNTADIAYVQDGIETVETVLGSTSAYHVDGAIVRRLGQLRSGKARIRHVIERLSNGDVWTYYYDADNGIVRLEKDGVRVG